MKNIKTCDCNCEACAKGDCKNCTCTNCQCSNCNC